jgi:hypothetical protein
MSDANRCSVLAYKDIDLSWMVGRALTELVYLEPDCWDFCFTERLSIRAECPWRIIKNGRIKLSRDDHGQKFGLPAHIDAAAAATALLAGVAITAVQLREATADLLIDLVGDLRLEIIPMSSGYESWQWNDPFGDSFFVTGGGEIVRFPQGET